MFANCSARKIFFKYALPCLEKYVTNGVMQEKLACELIEKFNKGEEMPTYVENIFKSALKNCNTVAELMGKRAIDEDVVRHYFLFEHDHYVDKQAALGMTKDPDYCKVWPGKVIELVDPQYALVHIPKKQKLYNRKFVPSVLVGDYVTVHRAYIAELIDESFAKQILQQKGFELVF